jgi:hypothetical protein
MAAAPVSANRPASFFRLRVCHEAYERMSYYERWTYLVAHDLIQRGVITVDDWNDEAALGNGSDASKSPTIEQSQQLAPRGA